MYYSVEFKREPGYYFHFQDDKYTAFDTCEDEPISITGTITLDDKQIGSLQIYELDNDCSFYSKCDGFSDDCATIAETICGEDGNVQKEYLPKCAKYDVLFILDRISIDAEYRGQGIGSSIVKKSFADAKVPIRSW